MRRMHPAGGFVAPGVRAPLARAAIVGAAALILVAPAEAVATAEVPRSLGSPAAVDPDRRVMWLIASLALEPRVVRATYRLRE